MKYFLLIFLVFAGGRSVTAQNDQVVLDYIAQYKDIAMEEMKRSGIPAAITLAQGIHESGAGQSDLVLKSNNHFGIKCRSDWTGESVSHTDDKPNECFRKYESSMDSYRDHSDFLKGSKRYAFLFELDPTNYRGWAFGLKRAGYATNPRYPQVLIKLIDDYQLENYTLIAMGRMKEEETLYVRNDTREAAEASGPVFAGITEPLSPGSAAETGGEPEEEVAAVNYPDHEFRLNETRVIYARKGISYLAIAEEYQLPLARIFEFNDMRPQDIVEKDQLIFLQRKRKTGHNEKHIVKKGESVYDIAQSEALRLSSLLEYNNLGYGSSLTTGQVLFLQAKAPGESKLTADK